MNRKERRQREKLRRTWGASPLPDGLQEAVSLHQTGRIGEALPLYQQFLTEQPDHPDALNYCGLAIYQLGDAGRALDLINTAVQIEPTNAGAHNNLGLVFQKLGRLDEAEGAYRHARSFSQKHRKPTAISAIFCKPTASSTRRLRPIVTSSRSSRIAQRP